MKSPDCTRSWSARQRAPLFPSAWLLALERLFFSRPPVPDVRVTGLTGLAAGRGRHKNVTSSLGNDRGNPWHCGPATRFDLLSDGLHGTRHLLVLTMYHITVDGWSAKLVLRDLSVLLRQGGRNLQSPALPISCSPYSARQHRWPASVPARGQIEYWKRLLSGATDRLELPLDQPRPVTANYRSATVEAVLPRELLEQLARVGEDSGATSFMKFLALTAVLLHGWSRPASPARLKSCTARSNPICCIRLRVPIWHTRLRKSIFSPGASRVYSGWSSMIPRLQYRGSSCCIPTMRYA